MKTKPVNPLDLMKGPLTTSDQVKVPLPDIPPPKAGNDISDFIRKVETEIEVIEESKSAAYFKFFFSYFDSINTLSQKNQYLAYKAIAEYAFEGKEDDSDLPKAVQSVLKIIRPLIKAGKVRQEIGFAGKQYGVLGASYGKKGGRPSKKKSKEIEK